MKDTGERLIPKGHLQTLTYGEHLSRYLSVADIVRNKIVLDIASGAGYGTHLISKTAQKVCGIDYSQEAITYAQKNYAGDNITYKVGDAHDIPLPDSSVDVVVSLETIEHLKEPIKFIKEVKRVLKKHGQFVVSTPNDDEYIEGNEFHLHEFDLKELKQLINDNFKNSDFYYQGTYFGAGLLSKETFDQGGQPKAIVSKTFGQPLQKAIYFLALASDEEINSLTETVVLADAWNTKDDLARDFEHQTRLGNAQTEAEGLRAKVTELSVANEALSDELRSIKNSKGWKLLTKVYAAKNRAKSSTKGKPTK